MNYLKAVIITFVIFGSPTLRLRAQDHFLAAQYVVEQAHFGNSAAIDGDYAVVGAPLENNEKGTAAGAVYVYKRGAAEWTFQARLVLPENRQVTQFGESIDISGDFIAVGVPYANGSGGNNEGWVYLFRRTGTSWNFIKKLTARDGETGARFGLSVALDGANLAVGAPGARADSVNPGAVYMYARTSAGWVLQKKLTGAGSHDYDNFGHSVALSGNTLVVGSPYDDTKGSAAGAFYVFKKSVSGWVQRSRRTASDGEMEDNLGFATAVHGNLIAVGAPGFDINPEDGSGAVYLYRLTSTGMIQEGRKTFESQPVTSLGSSVALFNDVVIAGAPLTDQRRGAVVLFERILNNQTPSWQVQANYRGLARDLYLGISVAIGTTHVLYGIPGYFGLNEGAAFIRAYDTGTVGVAPAIRDTAPETMASVADSDSDIPGSFVLHGNYPNPFNPSTTVRFDLPEAAEVNIDVVDLLGRIVLQSHNRAFSAGLNQEIQLEASSLASGTYLYRITARSARNVWNETGRMALVK